MKKTKRISPYSQNEIWDKDELLTIIKHEQFKRNKAVLALFWDLDARNHEITYLKIHIVAVNVKTKKILLIMVTADENVHDSKALP